MNYAKKLRRFRENERRAATERKAEKQKSDLSHQKTEDHQAENDRFVFTAAFIFASLYSLFVGRDWIIEQEKRANTNAVFCVSYGIGGCLGGEINNNLFVPDGCFELFLMTWMSKLLRFSASNLPQLCRFDKNPSDGFFSTPESDGVHAKADKIYDFNECSQIQAQAERCFSSVFNSSGPFRFEESKTFRSVPPHLQTGFMVFAANALATSVRSDYQAPEKSGSFKWLWRIIGVIAAPKYPFIASEKPLAQQIIEYPSAEAALDGFFKRFNSHGELSTEQRCFSPCLRPGAEND